MPKFYHGSDLELILLKKDSYVTKNFKDACKFGYRKSVLSGNPFVFIYSVEIETPEKSLEVDKNRDRAYITLTSNKVKCVDSYPTFETPFKLEKFKKDVQERS